MTNLSIIIPVYNGEKFIKRCLDSIISQDNGKIEVCLIDDGSKDNSSKLCEEYVSKYSYVHYYHKENGGVSSARNFGLKKASNEYIWFVDIDDEISNNAISEIFNCGDEDLIVFNYYNDNKERVLIDLGNKESHYIINDFNKFFNDFIFTYKMVNALWNKIYKREIIQKNNLVFDENLKIGEDFIFNLLYYKQIKEISFRSFPIYVYYIVEGSAMQRKDEKTFSYQMHIANGIKEKFKNVLTKNVLEQFLLMQLVCAINQSKTRGVDKKALNVHVKNYMLKIMDGKRFSRKVVNNFLDCENVSFLSKIKFKLSFHKHIKNIFNRGK